ncbi:hypothetical protein GIB67_016971 [Kingdonia uniflora]|uniref:Uncharacterized protein n=1 Tax=Kingdonia uniflora TaxID=39325 RepID=A0A7J7M3H6_9MAGN|nr:hypothetical protein GIB67_016971 [Kingdonia uniflora]
MSCIERLDTTLRLLDSDDNFEDPNSDKQIFNKDYDNAVKHLEIALFSSQPVLAALHPMIQLLLSKLLVLGDQATEALEKLEKLCCSSSELLLLGLKVILLKCFGDKDSIELSTHYEDILKKDPTCSHSLTRLIILHSNGAYGLAALIEMIALHLDASYGAWDIWRELASCFVKLLPRCEDQMPVCGNASSGDSLESLGEILRAFRNEGSRKSWKLRLIWWSTRHFSANVRTSEIKSGDLLLLTFKAACASHLYGPAFEYSASVYNYLEKKKSLDRISFLQGHIENSINFFDNMNKLWM